MSEQNQDFLRCRPDDLRQAMSIHTKKITDSCRDKDCIEDLRVYLTSGSQAALENASCIRARCAELIHTCIEVHPVIYDCSHYCIDITFYYRILVDAVAPSGKPITLYGLSIFSKKAVLCGEKSKSHIFRSDFPNTPEGNRSCSDNNPLAVVEVLDPMVLGAERL